MGFRLVLACAMGFSFGCDSGGPDPDDASDDTASPCEADTACNDGEFCNGEETCAPLDAAADASGCVAGTDPCPDASCNESTDACESDCPDADGDGARSVECGGSDCDDADSNRYPGNSEVCDADGHDEDCDDRTFGVRDADGDGSPDALCCNGSTCGDDCDDTRAAVNPLNVETCDGLDNDCNGTVDEDVALTFYEDMDGDDFGSDQPDADTRTGCMPPPGFATNQTDCNDADGGVNPGVPELCDGGVDNNCDGVIDEDCDCVVPASRACKGAMGVCASGMQTCVAGTWSSCSVMGTPEICDGIDNDCVLGVDNGVDVACYADPDRDGFAAVGATLTRRCACLGTETTVVPAGADIDCREAPASNAINTFPGAPELCDGIDNDCSSGGGAEVTEDRDGDGYTRIGFAGCSGGFLKTDCHDNNSDISPEASDFHTDGYCLTGSVCDCGGTERCIVVGAMGCTVCNPTSGSQPSYDYNCNGGNEPEPPRTGSCGAGGCVMACTNAGCGPSSSYPSSSCGTNVTFTCCGGCPCANFPTTDRLGCR